MNITVYCGSSFGDDPAFREVAIELGEWIAHNGHRLVYGGSDVGLMGALADAVLEEGGEAVGIELSLLEEQGVAHGALTELVVAASLDQRRRTMIELGDAFVALPGGIGTLDELSEVCTLARLRQLHAPVVILDVNGYYEPLRRMLADMVAHGFLPSNDPGIPLFVRDVAELVGVLEHTR